ncbi:MAG: hypothetical protein AB7N76_05355 [Planctomycetota bacterium]
METGELTLGAPLERGGLRIELKRAAHKVSGEGAAYAYRLELSGAGEPRALDLRGEAWQVEEAVGERLVVIRGFESGEPNERCKVELQPLAGRAPLDARGAGELAKAEAERRGLQVGSASAEQTSGGGAFVVEHSAAGGGPAVCRTTVGRYTRAVLGFTELKGKGKGKPGGPPPIIEHGPR